MIFLLLYRPLLGLPQGPAPAPSAPSFLASCLPHWAPGLEQISLTDPSGDLVASLFKNKTRVVISEKC